MLKKLNLVFTAMIAVLVMSIVGCNFNDFHGTIDGKEGFLSVRVTTNFSKEDSGAHYIVAPDYVDSELLGLKYILSGESLRGDSYSNEITFDASLKSTVDLSYDVWNLTLSAYKEDKLVLQGGTTADLSNGGNSISFNLTTKHITGTGDVSISGTYIDPNNVVNKYVMSIKDFNTGKVIESETVTTPATKQISFNKTDIAAGTYIFEVAFFKGTKQVGYYADVLRVVIGRTSTATGINFGEMDQVPAVPSNLIVTDVPNSYSEFGTYKVKLAWTDESTNEENFVVYVYEYETYNDDTSRNLVKVLDIVNKEDESRVILLGDDMYDDGSLLAGHEELTLELETGKIYDFEIAAKNCIGESDKVVRSESSDYKATGTENVARTSIRYYLNGGAYTKADGTLYDADVIYEFKKFNGTAIPLMTFTDPAKLELNGHPFSKWANGSSITATEVTEVTTVEDISVWAQYTTDIEITFTVEQFANILASSDVTAVDKDSANIKNGSLNVNAPGQKITFAVDNSTSFDYYQVRINDTVMFTGKVSDPYVLSSFVSYNSGEYNILVAARDKTSKQWYGESFKVTFER